MIFISLFVTFSSIKVVHRMNMLYHHVRWLIDWVPCLVLDFTWHCERSGGRVTHNPAIGKTAVKYYRRRSRLTIYQRPCYEILVTRSKWVKVKHNFSDNEKWKVSEMYVYNYLDKAVISYIVTDAQWGQRKA